MKKKKRKPPQVVDQFNQVYYLGKILGQGSQGAVYQVSSGKMAVKIIPENSSDKRILLQRLEYVKRLPLQGLPIAQPLAMLQEPFLGYVMELADDMVPLATLLYPEEENIGEWYIKTGGLGRRLVLLLKISQILHRVHSLALAYNDLSPNNIFVSSDPEYSEIYFIDSDNIYHNSLTAPSIYTPRYGAPELVEGKSFVSTLTDTYSFAVMAYQLLSLIHPLMGDMVVEGEPELEEIALAGKLPWVDSEDDSNASSCGIPREMVLSPRLKKMFTQTFEAGLHNPIQRPNMAKWEESLQSALDWAITCADEECQGTFYAQAMTCPWCGSARSNFVQMVIGRWEKGRIPGVNIMNVAISPNKKLHLTSRMTGGSQASEKPLLELLFKNDRLSIRALVESDFYLTSPSGKLCHKVQEKARTIPLVGQKTEWLLHFAHPDTSHRVARFKLKFAGGSSQ